MTEPDRKQPATRLVHLGRDPQRFGGAVNPPVYHASTIVAPDLATFEAPARNLRRGETKYGRTGTPTHHALESALSGLEGAADTVIFPSGLSAITTALFSVLRSGDHLLMVDSVYAPARKFCDGVLARCGVETTYYDPTIDAAGLRRLVRPETRAVFLESPGSMTFEVQDVPALAAAAKEAGLTVLMDNTWATPLYFRPLEHGVDLSIQAATKYIVGHSDAMLGAVSAGPERADDLRRTAYALGVCAGPDDVYLAQRGLRTLGVRLAQHHANAGVVARWLQQRDEVARVLYPALPEHPQHALWARDFEGASGLFSIVLARPYPHAAVAAMLDGLELFGIGASWGGYESLALTGDPAQVRSATAWNAPGPVVRLHIGLEDPADLIADLEAGFVRLAAAADI